MLSESHHAWTIVRAVGLTNAKKEEGIVVSFENEPKPTLTISRRSTAKYLVNALKEESLIDKSPVTSATKKPLI